MLQQNSLAKDKEMLPDRRHFLTGAALIVGMYGLNLSTLSVQGAQTTTERDPNFRLVGSDPIFQLR
jgi:hypothetical protein